MSYYDTCDICGANIDPGEKCDCMENRIIQVNYFTKLFDSDRDGQIRMKVEDFEYARN